MKLEILPVEGLPEIRPGDLLAQMLAAHATLVTGDILVVAQKVVSKAEARMVSLDEVHPTARAYALAAHLTNMRDPRAVQVVLDESVRVLRDERVLITETRHGFVCANSGVDHSNVPRDDVVTILPVDPDASAAALRLKLRELTGQDVGVIVSDTFGRAWRNGIANVALGVAGVPALLDLRGHVDDHGDRLTATVIAVADELAAAAGLVMGKTERVPAVIIRGAAWEARPGTGRDLIRPASEDLFR